MCENAHDESILLVLYKTQLTFAVFFPVKKSNLTYLFKNAAHGPFSKNVKRCGMSFKQLSVSLMCEHNPVTFLQDTLNLSDQDLPTLDYDAVSHN